VASGDPFNTHDPPPDFPCTSVTNVTGVPFSIIIVSASYIYAGLSSNTLDGFLNVGVQVCVGPDTTPTELSVLLDCLVVTGGVNENPAWSDI
jgi:hypothetical protein